MPLLDFLSRAKEPSIVPTEPWPARRARELRIALQRVDAEIELLEATLSKEYFGGHLDPRITAVLSGMHAVAITGDMVRFRFLNMERDAAVAKRAKLLDELAELGDQYERRTRCGTDLRHDFQKPTR